VEALLTDLLGAPVAVRRWERLEPWSVARVQLDGAGTNRTVIVKWVRAGPARPRTEPWRLPAEQAALQFLSGDLGLALAPRVIAADRPAGLLVLKDLASVSPWTSSSAATAPPPTSGGWPPSPAPTAS
jgi:hypothetical protein